MPHPLLTETGIAAHARDGAVPVRGLFRDHVDALRDGIARNLADPGPRAAENRDPGEAGRFGVVRRRAG
jgi:hypothetical protein